MKEKYEKIPDPKELEKELGDFLSKKFGGSVKLATPIVMPAPVETENREKSPKKGGKIKFDLKPEDLVSFLDQFIIKQDNAKAILSTKICTHFNRIKHFQSSTQDLTDMVGGIKNNVLMIGPTGVGKTYMIRLIAKKLGVPFVKGDATKFSETGYVGGDVEDLVRDLVREADGDIELAQCGIIYIDEIDKIASSRNLVGADVSRTGVQRALLKPMEETDVDLKVPHDPVSMIQEIDRFRKTGKKESNSVNTKNILFIMSGAFTGIEKIISKRLSDQSIGFGASISKPGELDNLLVRVSSEDLINFGFESEFVGRLPVRAIFEKLLEIDLCHILKNPNNPIILGKKLDFAAYGIDTKFESSALDHMGAKAFDENTGARGLVSAVERALLPFEKRLPSIDVQKFAITKSAIENPEETLLRLEENPLDAENQFLFEKLREEEKNRISNYIASNRKSLGDKFDISFTTQRIEMVADFYCNHVSDIEKAVERIKKFYEDTKSIELYFIKNHGINIVLEEDAIDYIILQSIKSSSTPQDFYNQLTLDFEHGLKLVREKTSNTRFFITKDALKGPEAFIANLLKNRYDNPLKKSKGNPNLLKG